MGSPHLGLPADTDSLLVTSMSGPVKQQVYPGRFRTRHLRVQYRVRISIKFEGMTSQRAGPVKSVSGAPMEACLTGQDARKWLGSFPDLVKPWEAGISVTCAAPSNQSSARGLMSQIGEKGPPPEADEVTAAPRLLVRRLHVPP